MKSIWMILFMAALITGCSRPTEPEPGDEIFDIPANAKRSPIDPPGLTKEAAEFQDLEAACAHEHEHAQHLARQSGQKIAAPGLGPVQVQDATTLGASGNGTLPEQLSIDDQPPSGGDGSFTLNLGKLGTDMGGGKYATHSHPKPHTLWVIDMPESKRRTLTYQTQAIPLTHDSTVEFAIEQLDGGAFGGRWRQRGVVTMNQGKVVGYDTLLAKQGHKPCTEFSSYAWSVSARGLRLNTIGSTLANLRVNVQRPIGIAAIRLAEIRVSSSVEGKPKVTIPLRSGCAAFQICDNKWSRCKPIEPPCPYLSVEPRPTEARP